MCILTHAFTLEVQTQSEHLKEPSPNLSKFEITKASIGSSSKIEKPIK